MDNSYAKAYTEVLEILKKLPEEEYRKIPMEEIDFLMLNCDNNYKFSISKKIPLKEQHISKKANAVLVSYFNKYFATENQKKILRNILIKNFEKEEEIKRSLYSEENLFKNKQQSIEITNDMQLVKYNKNNIFQSITNFIKNIFYKFRK